MKMWYTVDRSGTKALFPYKPRKEGGWWIERPDCIIVDDSIRNLLENMPELLNMTWKDEPRQVELQLSGATKKEPTIRQKLKAALKSILALVLLAVFYIVYIPVGILRAVVDLDRFSDFADALMEMMIGFRLAWRKAIRKVKGGE